MRKKCKQKFAYTIILHCCQLISRFVSNYFEAVARLYFRVYFLIWRYLKALKVFYRLIRSNFINSSSNDIVDTNTDRSLK